MSDKTTVVNIDDIIDRSVDSGLDKVISQMTNLGDAASSTKEKIKGINEEAKKTEDTLSDMTSTMNVLFANRKGKNKGIFNSNDEKVAKKVIANVKDQVLANQQLAKIEKVISTGRVKYYTDEANALKHVEKSYKLYLEAKEKGLSDKVVNSRQNDVLRWGHSYLATLSDESKSQFNVLGNEFIAFWDKIQHKVYDKSGGLLSYSKENMKETFSFMKEMESNGFDLTVFKPEQVTVIEKTRKEVEKTTAAIGKLNKQIEESNNNNIRNEFFQNLRERVKKFNTDWEDGKNFKQKDLISLYQDMSYYRSQKNKDNKIIDIPDIHEILEIFEKNSHMSPFSEKNFAKISEFTDGYVPESLKSLKKDTEELTVVIEEQTKAIEKRNDALKDGANTENINPKNSSRPDAEIDNLKNRIEIIKKEKAILSEIREDNNFGDYGKKDSMSEQYYNEEINNIKSINLSYEEVLSTLTKIRELKKEQHILYGQMNGLNTFSDESKRLKTQYDEKDTAIKELESKLPILSLFEEKINSVISRNTSDGELILFVQKFVEYLAQAKLELGQISDLDFIRLIQTLSKLEQPVENVKKESELANKELKKLGEVYRAVRSQDLEFLNHNQKNGAIWATSQKDLYNTLYTGQNQGKEYSAEYYARNPLVIDAKGQQFNSITYLGDGTDEASKQITELYDEIQRLTKAREEVCKATGMESQEYIELSKQLGLVRTKYDELSKSKKNVYGTHFSDEFVDLAKANGYDALKIENIYDSTGELATSYAVWSEEQVKNIQLIASGEKELLQLHNQLSSTTILSTEEATNRISELEEKLLSLGRTYNLSFNKNAKYEYEFDGNIKYANELQSILSQIYEINPNYSIDKLLNKTQVELQETINKFNLFDNTLKDVRKGTREFSFNKLLLDPDVFASKLNDVAKEYYELINLEDYDEKKLLNIEARFNALLSSMHQLDFSRTSDTSIFNRVQNQLNKDTKDLEDIFWERMANDNNMSNKLDLKYMISDRLNLQIVDQYDIDRLKEIINFLQDIELIKDSISNKTLIANEEKVLQHNLDIVNDLKKVYLSNWKNYGEDPALQNNINGIVEYYNKAEETKKKIAELNNEIYTPIYTTKEIVENEMLSIRGDSYAEERKQIELITRALFEYNIAQKTVEDNKKNRMKQKFLPDEIEKDKKTLQDAIIVLDEYKNKYKEIEILFNDGSKNYFPLEYGISDEIYPILNKKYTDISKINFIPNISLSEESSGQLSFIEGLEKTSLLIEEESGQMALFKVESENATDTAIEGQMHLNDYINKNIEDQITLNNLLEQQTKRDKILEKSKNNYIDVVDRPKSEYEVLDSAYKMISDIEWYDANFNRKKLNNYADEIKQNKLLQEEYKEDAELLSVLKQEAYLLKAEFIAMYDVMMSYDGLEDDYGKIIHTGFSSMRKSNHELYDTLFNESRQLEQTSIAITADIVKAAEKKHKYRLASLSEIPKLAKQEQQAYIETDKIIEQSAEKVIEVNKQKNDHLAYLEKERKEKEQLLGVEKELDKIRSKNPDDGKYLSQTGIVGSEDGWSLVKSLGYAQTQKINYGYNEDTGLLEKNPEKIVTNFEKLKNAIIATDKAVQRLKYDLKLTQEKNPGVDTSYLEKNISYVEAHLSALKEERDSYAKSGDYQETYKKHNEEIQEAHDKFANSLSQKDAISEYTQNQQRLIDIHKELNKLEDRRFNLNKGLISGSTKTPDADKKELLDIEKKSLDLTQEKINIEKSHGGNVLKEEIELQKKRIANEERLNELKKNASEKQQIDDAKEVNKLYDDLNAKLVRRYELEKRIKTNTSESYDNTKDLSALQKTNREIETLQQKRLTLGSKDNPARSKETDLKDLELQKKLLNEVVLAYGKANDELRNLEAQSNTPGYTKVYDPILESKREQVEKLRVEAEKAVDSMFKLYSKGDISNDDYVKLYNTYQSGTANSNAADQAKAQEQFNKNKQAALDEKEAVDLLKESLKDLSKIYGQLSSSAKNGFSSLSFQTNLQLLQDQLNKVSEYKNLAKKSSVSDDKISLLEKDYFKKSSSEIRKEGLSSISKFIADIDKYENKLRTSGELTEKTQTKFDGLRNALTYLFKDADFNTPEGLQDFIKAISVLGDNFQNTLNDVSKQNKFEFINNWITNFDKLSYKSDDVKSKLAELKALVSNYESAKTSGNNQLIKEKEIELLTKAPGLINKIKQAASGKGNLVDNTLGNVNNIDDLNRALLEYAKNKGYVKALGTSLKSSNGEVTGTFIDQNGAVIKLTASMDQMVNGMREVTSTQRGAVGLFGSFKSALNSAAQSLAFYFSGTALIRRFFTEFRQGIDVLKKYDSALTNISYTMNMSKDSLQELGQSAIEMAKDLSMSLENTMSIYQIYANMQTTAEEIAETARPTAILSNLSGTNASTASDQIQGILNQFSMLKDADVDVAETSMHVVDVLDKISANVAIDYAKGIGIISDAVTATGQAAYDAGMSYEQLAAVSAKVAERTREDGSSIGNAIKTILTRISKVGKMPSYADEVDNETLSNASKSLNEIGIAVYNADGSFRNISVILSELSEKWNTLTDAQQSNIAYNVAATRQSNKFRAILEAWTSATELATEATNTLGNAEANQEKYLESYNGKIQQITTQMDAFWLSLFNSEAISDVLDFIIELTKAFNGLADAITPLGALLVSFSGLIGGLTLGKYIKGLGKDGIVQLIKNFGRTKKFVLYKYAEINKCSLGY